MQFLKFIADLLVFILSLGVLIIVHELGHLGVAKLFKVYCYEFSVGMGPALYQKKPKKGKGETVFSIRALPIGGYVSMAGEEDEKEDGPRPEIVVPKERTIEGISHPRKALIMVAGVAVNFLIGYILFFCNYAFCPQPNLEVNNITVMKNSAVAELGLKTGDRVTALQQDFVIDGKDVVQAKTEVESYTEISDILSCYELDKNGNIIADTDYRPLTADDYRLITLTVIRKGQTSAETLAPIRTGTTEIKDGDKTTYEYDKIGISAYKSYVGLGNAFVLAGKQWAIGCGAIFVALGQIFTPAGWSQMGGVVSMFKISSMATQSGLSVFFNLWGLISVNLAIFNLLPFPGLDGWQLVVTGIEGVSKKKVPAKFKQIASIVGLVLLFGLMIVLLVKDIFFPAI